MLLYVSTRFIGSLYVYRYFMYIQRLSTLPMCVYVYTLYMWKFITLFSEILNYFKSVLAIWKKSAFIFHHQETHTKPFIRKDAFYLYTCACVCVFVCVVKWCPCSHILVLSQPELFFLFSLQPGDSKESSDFPTLTVENFKNTR